MRSFCRSGVGLWCGLTDIRCGVTTARLNHTRLSSVRASHCRTFSSTNNKPFVFQDVLEQKEKLTPEMYRVDDLSAGIQARTLSEFNGRRVLTIAPYVLREIAKISITEISHLLRSSHLQQLRNILDDPEASENDRFVAIELLKNANIAAAGILPGCQDTGTAIVIGKKGENVFVCNDMLSKSEVQKWEKEMNTSAYVKKGVLDEAMLSLGVYDAYTRGNLRYSQLSPTSMFDEVNTKTNLPAQIELLSTAGNDYDFLFLAKGGGSANKTFLYQQSKALLNEDSLRKFLEKNIKTIGTAACPPYHLAIVIGGLSAEMTLKTVKLASCRYLDGLWDSGNEYGRGFRDTAMEAEVLKMTQEMGIGAQFGGKFFCHDVRVVRLPRHGASCPVGIGVSCSADRQVVARINEDGVFIEKLESDPSKYLPDVTEHRHLDTSSEPIKVNLNQSMSRILDSLRPHPVKTRLLLTGTIVVARDSAHAKLLEILRNTGSLPDYVKNHPIYYAGPAKTPEGYASGSFGPTTAGRMDTYVEEFMAAGGSMVTLAKGNRSKAVTLACKKHKGFYLGSIGGPAAILATNCIKKVEKIAFPELGMEAIWQIDVVDFPAFIVIDDKGNDFFKEWLG